MYHRFASREEYARAAGTERIFTLPTDAFEEQVAYLKSAGYCFATADEARRYAAGTWRPSSPAVLLTIDDGCASAGRLAHPILRRHGACATVFVTTDPGAYVFRLGETGDPRLGDDELRSLDGETMRFESHAVTHRPLRALEENEIRRELADSKRELERILGREVRHLAIPGNWYDGRVMRIARECGYEAVWCSKPGDVRPGASLFGLPRLNVEGPMTLPEFIAMISPSGVAKRRLVSAIKRVPGWLLGPRVWLPLRKVLLRLVPGHYLSTRRVLGAVAAFGAVVVAMLVWLLLRSRA